MKKYILIPLVVAAAGILGACSDELELPVDGRIEYDAIWSDRNRTMGYLNTCYNYCPGADINTTSYTDDAQSVDDYNASSSPTKWYSGTVSATSWIQAADLANDVWATRFQGIRYCNVFISEMPSATAYTKPGEKEGWIAQAKTIRALIYLNLIKKFGPVPLFTEPLALDHNYAGDSRTPVWKIVQQIIQDTDDALAAPGNDLTSTSNGFTWAITSENAHMMHRALAYMIRSEAILFAVSPLNANEEGNPYTWEDAAKYTKEALDQCLAHDYELYKRLPLDKTETQNEYSYYFLTEYDYNRSLDKETIYQQGTGQVSVWNNYGLPMNNRMTSAGFCPTQELVDCYESVETNSDGVITASYPVLNLENPYRDENHLRPNYNTDNLIYDEDDPYANRDPRFYASIYYNGAIRHLDEPDGDVVETFEGGNCEIKTSESQTNTRTGYYMRKYNRHTSSSESADEGYFRTFRLAELYLNFAEAANEAYGPSVSVSSDAGSAMTAAEAVNTVRARVGMPAITPGDADSFRYRIRNERRVEFAFEALRFFDVRRWMILDETDRVVTGMKPVLQADDSYSYERYVVSNRNSYEDKYLRLPLPYTEVVKMYKHTGVDWQNPGWEGAE